MVTGVLIIVMVSAAAAGFLLDLPEKTEKIVDGARKPQRSGGLVAVNLIGFIQKAIEKMMIKKRNRNHKSLRA